MDPNTGNSASAAGPKKDKKAKKNYEDGDGKKKFVSTPPTCCTFYDLFGYKSVAPNPTDGDIFFTFQVKLQSNTLQPYL